MISGLTGAALLVASTGPAAPIASREDRKFFLFIFTIILILSQLKITIFENMRFLLVILLLSGYGWEVKGQDLTGQWTGTATDRVSENKQKLVLSITEGDSSFGGVLHWYSPETQTIRHILVSGRFFGRDSILTIREDSSRSNGAEGSTASGVGRGVDSGTAASGLQRGTAGPPGGFYILFYRRTAGHRDMLEGHWHTSDNWTGREGDLTISLEKK